MSKLSINNNAWLSKLRSHLDAECYGAATMSQYMGVARRFVADLNKRRVAITAARPVAAAITPAAKLQQEICEAYSLWMIDFRGLARTTILCRRNEACSFLGWLGALQPQRGFSV